MVLVIAAVVLGAFLGSGSFDDSMLPSEGDSLGAEEVSVSAADATLEMKVNAKKN